MHFFYPQKGSLKAVFLLIFRGFRRQMHAHASPSLSTFSEIEFVFRVLLSSSFSSSLFVTLFLALFFLFRDSSNARFPTFAKVQLFRIRNSKCSSSIPVLDVGAHVLELGEDLGEERRLRVDPEHGLGEEVDDADAAVPEAVLVALNQERLQGVADLVAHVAGKMLFIFSILDA